MAWLAGGPVGAGRLAEVGPAAPYVALAVTVPVTLAAVVTAAVARRRAA